MKTMIWYLSYIQLWTAVQGLQVRSFQPLNYEIAWDVSNRKDFNFKVNCKKDVLISVTDALPSIGYNIIIGGNYNTFTSLRSCMTCDFINSTKVYSSPLSDGNFTAFWINWSGRTLRLGAGNVIGENIYFQYENMTRIMTPQKIFFGTMNANGCLWEVPDYQIIVTPSGSPFTFRYLASWNVAGIPSLKFSIKTCGSLNMFLYDNPSLSAVYFIQIGFCQSAAPCTKITERSGQISVVAINPFNCSHYVPIWLDWSNSSNIIDIGIGNHLHENTLVRYANDSNFDPITRLVITSIMEARLKPDIYGCDYTAWEDWSSWSKCGPGGRSQVRNRDCQCKTPPSSGPFDADIHCDGYSTETIFDNSLVCKEWKFIDHHSSPSLSKLTTKERSKIVCAMMCQLEENCQVFSYNVSSNDCFLYEVPYDEIHFTSPGTRTYGLHD